MHLVVSCPRCHQQLKVAQTALGQSIRCPCGNVFAARPGAATAPTAPAVTAPQPTVLASCTHCKQPVRVPESARGRQVKCPRCATVFTVAAEKTAIATPPPSPARTQPVPPPAPPSQAVARPARTPAPPRDPGGGRARDTVPTAPRSPRTSPQPAPSRKKLLDRVTLSVAVVVLLYAGAVAMVASGVFGRKPADEVSGKPGPNKIDVSFIPPDAGLAVIVHPKRLLQAPALASLPEKRQLASLTRGLGLDPSQVDQAVLVLDLSPGAAAPFAGGILHFSSAVDGKKLFDQFLHGVKEKTFEGKTYYQGNEVAKKGGAKVCGHVPDNHTLLVAPEPALRRMLARGGAKSPLTEQLRTVDVDGDVVAVVAVAPYRQLLTQAINSADKALPPQLAAVKTLPDQLNSVTVALNLTGDTLLTLVLDTTSPAAAKDVRDLVNTGLELIKQVYPQMRQGMLAQLPPRQAKSVGKVADELLNGIRVSTDGARVIVSVKAPRGLTPLVKELTPLIRQSLTAEPLPPPVRPVRPVRPRKPSPEPAEKDEPAVPVKKATKDIRAEAAAWLKANNRFGPEHDLVGDTATKLRAQVLPDQGFCLRLGSGLLKSGKQTLLCGWGELFVFELTAAQEKAYPLAPNTTVIQSIGGNVQGPQELLLSPPKIDHADRLDGSQRLTGTLPFKWLAKKGKGLFTVRLVLMNQGRTAYYPQIMDYISNPKGVFPFTLLPLNQMGVNRTGPVVLLMEVVKLGGPRAAKRPAISNPVAVLVNLVASPEAEAVAAIKQLGGRVETDFRNPTGPVVGVDFAFNKKITDETLDLLPKLTHLERLYLGYTPITPAGLARLQGLKGLKSIDLAGIKIADADLAPLAKLSSLEALTLDARALTDAGLARLSTLTRLKRLNLYSSKITDAGLAHLKQMTQMENLELGGTALTGSGFDSLQGMANLSVLTLDGCKVTDAGLARLAHLGNLTDLRLNDTSVTDAGLVHLKGLKKLRTLALSRTAITGTGLRDVTILSTLYADGSKFNDAGLKAIGDNATIWQLSLASTPVTDAGVKHLKGMAQLRGLNLSQTRVTGTGLAVLKGLKWVNDINLYKAPVTDEGLKFVKDLAAASIFLNLGSTRITDAGLAHFKGVTNIYSLSLSDTRVTDAGLSNLEGLTRASQILFYRTAVTPAGVAKLKKALPRCRIEASPIKE